MKRTASVVLEQAAVSLSSGLLLISLIRVTPLEVFGALSLAYVVVQLALAMTRYSLLIPLHTTDSSSRARVQQAHVLALVAAGLGLVVTPLSFGTSSVILGQPSLEAAAIAVSAPLIFVNEALRQFALSANRVQAATMAAVAWLILSVTAFLFVTFGSPSAMTVIGLWVLGLLVSVLLLSAQPRSKNGCYGTRRRAIPARLRSFKQGLTDSVTRPHKVYFALGIGIPSSILLLQFAIAESAGAIKYGILAVNALAWTPVAVWLAALPVVTSRGYLSSPVRVNFCWVKALLLIFFPPVTWALLLSLAMPLFSDIFLGGQAATVKVLIPVTALSFMLFSAQSVVLLQAMRAEDRRGVRWAVVAALAGRGLASLVVLGLDDPSLVVYVLAEALCHGLIVATLLLRRTFVSLR